ncbi:MoaF C-terminal domain-containing protein [Modestobacter sp. VKM Ac-2978]|uniref:MoaF C-terminal domain-containing protein n=1 Tax=Modestobacter sp. VKM Ac-2978 TaxID=3004132 RepID=UPI0022AAADC8|nr:MoaF C-terminal domain-containing protein [Modestobacter sp. VKM Ac-2978]MCZ2850868.1 MoaF N-terminal domain-containing protein [Modestobacter sp. VKM Ac-2978]
MSGRGEFAWDAQSWTPLSEMAEGFDEFRPPVSGALVGRTITLTGALADGGEAFSLEQRFTEDRRLDWVLRVGDRPERSGTATYQAFELADELFYVHQLWQGLPRPEAASFALDLANGTATGALAQLGLEPDPHRARQQWFQATIDGRPADPHPHQPTTELVGQRIRYRYSSDDVYDHVYLTDRLFTWVCMGGAEQGEADTERCVHWKIREGVYLFSWLEKLLGVEGMVLVDLTQLRSVGIQFALDQFSGELVDLTMGAYAQPLSEAPPVSTP